MPGLSFDDKYLWTDNDFDRPLGRGLSASLPRHSVPYVFSVVVPILLVVVVVVGCFPGC
jgi:hypothetical protein